MDRVNVGGLMFHNLDMEECLFEIQKKIKDFKENTQSEFILVANQDILNQITKISSLKIDELNRSFLVIPDGYSIIYAAKYLKTPLKERVTGPDLMFKFMEISNEKGYKNYFLGAKEGVASLMAENFLKKFSNLKISGIYSPPFCDKFTNDENNKIINMINESESDVLWVSFGCPKQEIWILENLNKLRVPVIAGVGAAFDFHSGNVKRAPKFIQKLRLEWFYRILQEPKRLWKRYFFGGIDFFKLITHQKKIK
ncbi:MAG TPA: WecB/TagA/CpsF family glycosyltransferase [Spirochaetota bacterium]|nr:WecB/TagA/CpsF family glycosyltransferase [Spirochaetota bacterium]